jgi:hypothetical protein
MLIKNKIINRLHLSEIEELKSVTSLNELDACYGIAADEHQSAVFTYGCGGRDAELVMWLKL